MYRLSPDGEWIAIRRPETDPDAWNAWGIFHRVQGGAWANSAHVADWTELVPA